MRMKKIYFAAPFLIAFAIFIFTPIFFGNIVGQTNEKNYNAEGGSLKYHSSVCKEIIRANGERKNLGCGHNLFTNLGKNISRDLLGLQPFAAGTGAVNVIGLGNSSTTQLSSDTVLGSEWVNCGLGRAAGTVSKIDSSVGNWTISNVFTNGCANDNVNATGLYNSTSGNWLFAETTLSGIGNDFLQPSDQLNITWYIWIS